MKTIGLLLASLLVLSGQAPTPAHAPQRHLVYRFGYNTKVADSGNGTGTTTVDIMGPAADGGVVVTGTDFWWNAVRARATNTCEVYPSGSVKCTVPAAAISPMQLTLFPLLARKYFSGLSSGPHASWTNDIEVTAAIVPGASGYAGQVTTWKCVFQLTAKGPVAGSEHQVLVGQVGTLTQQSGRHLKATEKAGIVYIPAQKVPAYIDERRTHVPQRSTESFDTIQLKLTSVSPRY